MRWPLAAALGAAALGAALDARAAEPDATGLPPATETPAAVSRAQLEAERVAVREQLAGARRAVDRLEGAATLLDYLLAPPGTPAP